MSLKQKADFKDILTSVRPSNHARIVDDNDRTEEPSFTTEALAIGSRKHRIGDICIASENNQYD